MGPEVRPDPRRPILPNAFHIDDALLADNGPEAANAFKEMKRTGQIEGADGGARYVYTELAAGNTRQSTPVLPLARDLIANNRTLVRPSVLPAVNGDPGSRKLYEDCRIIAVDALPGPVISEIYQIVTKHNRSAEAEQRRIANRYGGRLVESANKSDNHMWVTGAGLRSFYCAATGLELAEMFKSFVSDHDPTDPETWGAVRWRFSPTSQSLYGAFARKAFIECIPIMFRAALVQDYLEQLEVELDDRSYLRLISASPGTWDLVETPSFRRISEVVEALDQRPELSADRSVLVSKLLFDKRWDRTLERMTAPPKLHEIREVRDGPANPLDYRQQILAGLVVAMAPHGLAGSAAKDLAKKIFAVMRRGGCTYTEVVQGFGAGEAPAAVYERALQSLRSSSDSAVTIESAPTSAAHAEVEESKSAPGVEILMNRDVDAWIKDLPRSEKSRVFVRLERAAKGNLGWYEPIREGLFELKFAHGVGIRLYFRFLSPDRIALVSAGTKATQARDIEPSLRVSVADPQHFFTWSSSRMMPPTRSSGG